MLKRIYVSSVEAKKSGISAKGTKWTLYNVTDQEGKKYSTFESNYNSMVGMEIEREVVEEPYMGKDGVQRSSFKLIEPGKTFQGVNPQKMQLENAGHSTATQVNIVDKFKAIEKRLDAIEAEIRGLKADPSGEFTSPDPVDLPF